VRDSELMPFDEKFFREIAASASSACRSAIGSTPSTAYRLALSQSCICSNLTKNSVVGYWAGLLCHGILLPCTRFSRMWRTISITHPGEVSFAFRIFDYARI